MPIGPAVAVFLLLAAADHLVVALPRVAQWYERNVHRGVNYTRWASASLMVVLIAMFTGIGTSASA